MRKQRSIAIILTKILFLGFLIIPSCTAFPAKEKQSSAQTSPNAAVINNDIIYDMSKQLASVDQPPTLCSMPNMAIPDLGTRQDIISVPITGTLSDMDVYVNILHTYVGDLIVSLNHTGKAGPVTLINRLGCSGSNIDVIINDEGKDGSILSQCAGTLAIFGNRIGGNPAGPVLSAFDGNDYSGEWVLSISDNSRSDVGTLVKWCLIPTIQPSGNSGAIEIIKDAVPDSPQDFAFTATDKLTPSTFSLDDDANNTLPNVQVYNNVNADIYTISEEPVSGYTTSISCNDPTGDTFTTGGNATIDLAAGETVSCTFVSKQNMCYAGTFALSGTDPHAGIAGNIKTFSINGVNVNVSGWSRDKTTGIYAQAYLGAYPYGLGVTDLVSDGNGSSNQHAMDNKGADNYLLFEFDQPITVDNIRLGFILTTSSDVTVWFGYAPGGVDPYTNHQTLNGGFLNGLVTETNIGTSSIRLVDINGGNQSGNILVVAPKIGDSNDYFKVDKLTIACPN